ncbi:hypothetical protein [Streptomyces sp. NBC_00690]|uniref:hypothetical protein n=1 Tax=Streptomyces sp. NBC_00690 TaxID=2975808 RepID=UPI002E2A7867|nr:hypothetical protein [Streptomyces sp. NBC_00690]
MRMRTLLAALALTVAGIAGASTASAQDFGDIIITIEQDPRIVVGCSPGFVVDSESAQCGIYDILG